MASSTEVKEPVKDTLESKDVIKYYKVLRGDLIHYKFKYQVGLNIDKVPFNPTGACNPGGLYYTDLDNIHRFLNDGEYVAEVEPRGQVYADADLIKDDLGKCDLVNGRIFKWKTDRLFIVSLTPIGTWISNRPEIKLKALKYSGWCLRFIKSPTYEEKLLAVSSNGYAIRLITDPDDTLKLAAVKQNGLAWRFIKNPTKAITTAALAQDPKATNYGYNE